MVNVSSVVRFGVVGLWLGVLLVGCGTGSKPTQPSGDLAGFSGLRADYFSGIDYTGQTVTQIDRQINFNWGATAPVLGFQPGNFSARWSGHLKVNKTDTYQFFLDASGQAQLSLEGQALNSGEGRLLEVGKSYALELRYVKTNPNAALSLQWSSAGMERQVVGQQHLSPGNTSKGDLTVQAVPVGTNLLLNSQFEGGTGNWVKYGGEYSTITPGRNGTGQALSATGWAWVQQDLPVSSVEVGQSYTLRGFGRTLAGSTCTLAMAGGPAGQRAFSETLTFRSNAWEEQATSLTVPSGTVWFSVYMATAAAECQFDDLSLVAGSTPPPPPPASTELILNGGFESDFVNWGRYGGTSSLLTPGQTGAKALQLSNFAWVQQDLLGSLLKAGQSYTLSGYGQSAAGEVCALNFVGASASQTLFSVKLEFSSLGWQQKNLQQVIPAGVEWAAVYLTSGAGGCAFDQISLSSQPPQTDYSGTYNLINTNSNKCVEVAGASLANDANIQQWTCGTGNHQVWKVEKADKGYRFTAMHSGKVMDVASSSTSTAANVLQWSWGNTDNQKWNIRSTATGLELTAVHSNKCLDISSSGLVNGTNVQQWDCNNTSAQRFRLTPVTVAPSDKSQKGEWGSLINFPLIPVAAASLPNGKVMFWSAYDRFTFGGSNGYTQTALFDPETLQTTQRTVSNTGHDMFCPGTAMTRDGRVIVMGGSNAEVTSIYNATTNAWTREANLQVGRGYNTALTLMDGRVLTIGAGWSGVVGSDRYAEAWTAGSGWQGFPGASSIPMQSGSLDNRGDEHAWLMQTPDGRILSAGPSTQMTWYSLSGSGSYTSAGTRSTDVYSQNSAVVKYDTGKVLKAGGQRAYGNGASNALAYVIDMNSGLSVRPVASMQYARTFATAVMLPTGEVLMVGGNTSGAAFSDSGSVLIPEVWNPSTEQWRTLAPMSVPRNYHSVALLLPDGRVLAAGGGLCGSGCAANHPDGQIFTPPYLFNIDGTPATRPSIVTAPTAVAYGQSFSVTTTSAVSRFTLVRMSSVTHSVNTDQSFVNLSSNGSNTAYTVTAPSNAQAVPGFYMLFALNAQGVPSLAKIIRVG